MFWVFEGSKRGLKEGKERGRDVGTGEAGERALVRGLR